MSPETLQQLQFTATDLENPDWVYYIFNNGLMPVIAQSVHVGSVEGILLYLPHQPVLEGASVERCRHGVFEVVTTEGKRMTTYAVFLTKDQMVNFGALVKEAAAKSHPPARTSC